MKIMIITNHNFQKNAYNKHYVSWAFKILLHSGYQVLKMFKPKGDRIAIIRVLESKCLTIHIGFCQHNE